MKLKGEINTENFVKFIESKPSKVLRNVNSKAEQISEVIERNTKPKVPLDTGALEDSFFSDRFIEKDLYTQTFVYSARNPRDGFNYAEIQHIKFPVKRIKGQTFYLKEGMEESTEPVLKIIEKAVVEAIK